MRHAAPRHVKQVVPRILTPCGKTAAGLYFERLPPGRSAADSAIPAVRHAGKEKP